MTDAQPAEPVPLAECPVPPRSRRGRWLWLAAALVVVYAAGVGPHWRVQRDSALYLGLGRSLAEGRGYTFNHRPHTLALPGLPAAIAAWIDLAGPLELPDGLLVPNAAMALAGLACIALAAVLLRQIDAGRGAFAPAMLLVALSPSLYACSTYVMTDVPYTLVTLLAVWAGLRALREEGAAFRGWCALHCALVAVAVTVRPFGPAPAVAFAAALWLRGDVRRHRVRNVLGGAAALCAAFVPLGLWAVRSARVHVAGADSYARSFQGGRVLRLAKWAIAQVPELFDAVGEATTGVDLSVPGGLIVTAVVVFGLVHMARRREWLVPAYLAVHCGGMLLGSPGERLLLPVMPLLAYALVLGALELADAASRRRGWDRRRLVRAMGVVLALVLAWNTAQIGAEIAQGRSRRYYETLDGGRWAVYFDVARELDATLAPDDVVLAYESRLIHLLTRRPVVFLKRFDQAHDEWEVGDALAAGHVRYIVYDPRKEEWEGDLRAFLEGHSRATDAAVPVGRVKIVRLHLDALEEEPTGAD